jgi:hypothetical protein
MPEEKEPSCPAGGNVSWCNHCENQYEVPQKLKIELPYDPSVPSQAYIQRNVSQQAVTKLHTHVYSSTVYHRQDMEST